MNVTAKLADFLAYEEDAARFRAQLVDEICKSIEDATPLDGVTAGPADASVRWYSIRISSVAQDKRHCLSPDFYLQKQQAALIRSVLAPKQTVSKIVETLQKASEDESVVANGYRAPLNAKTLEAIRKILPNVAPPK